MNALDMDLPNKKLVRHSGRAERDPEPRGYGRAGCSWVPGSRCASPGMTGVGS